MVSSETLKEWDKTLTDVLRKKNIMTVIEFEKFLPLFKKDTPIDDTYNKLCVEYQKRVSLFHPIVIVDTSGKELFKLSNMFHSVDTFNGNTSAILSIKAFANALSRDYVFDAQKEKTTIDIIKKFVEVQDKDRIKQSVEEYSAIVENLKKNKVEEEVEESLESVPQVINQDDWDWK